MDIILGCGQSGSLNQLFKDCAKVVQMSGHLSSLPTYVEISLMQKL